MGADGFDDVLGQDIVIGPDIEEKTRHAGFDLLAATAFLVLAIKFALFPTRTVVVSNKEASPAVVVARLVAVVASDVLEIGYDRLDFLGLVVLLAHGQAQQGCSEVSRGVE